jgi:hypothetical protein
MSEPNLGGFNSKPSNGETKDVDPITPGVDPVASELPEADVTEVDVTEADVTEADVTEADVTEADVTEAPVMENSVEETLSEEIAQDDQSETPLNLPVINTTYTSPDSENIEPDSSIAALPEEKVEKTLTEPELRERIEKLTSEIDELVDVASKSDAEMESEGENLEERIRVQEEFTHWVAKRRSDS